VYHCKCIRLSIGYSHRHDYHYDADQVASSTFKIKFKNQCHETANVIAGENNNSKFKIKRSIILMPTSIIHS